MLNVRTRVALATSKIRTGPRLLFAHLSVPTLPLRSRQLRAVSAVWLGILALLLIITANYGDAQSNDAVASFLPAWKLAWYDTLQLPEFDGRNIWINSGPWGTLSNRLPGTILWATPFYRALGTANAPTFFPAGIAAATAVSLGAIALFATMKRLLPADVALGSVTILVLGTGVWTTAADALWPHGPDVLWLAMAMLWLSRDRWKLAGCAFALAILTRPHLAVASAVIGVWLSVERRSWRPVLQLAWTSTLGVLCLVAWNRVVWRQWALLPDFYAARVLTASQTATAGSSSAATGLMIIWDRLGGTFVSPGRGLLVYSPFLLFLFPGICYAWRDSPPWVRACALGGVSYMAVQLLGNSFGGGDGFTSYRLSIELIVLTFPLLAVCWVAWTVRRFWRRAAFASLVWIAVLQHAVGAFVGHDDHVVRDPWRSYGLASRLPMASTVELLLLLGIALISAVLLRRVAVHPPAATE